ncbi:MAG: Ada Zn binding protein [Patescibacteria group bacterium]|jgi:hypothetical protein|nr:Ada Zn binding protein [Patescibacteria group bacterium]
MKNEFIVIIILILVSLASFGLGRMSVLDKKGSESGVEFLIPELSKIDMSFSGFPYLASINGTKFYGRGCKSSNRIKAENRIYFKTSTDAVKSGYGASSTC